jgi:hypothetical protein
MPGVGGEPVPPRSSSWVPGEAEAAQSTLSGPHDTKVPAEAAHQERRRGGERERSRMSSLDGLAIADHNPDARGRGERWCASRRTTLLALGLKSVGGEAVPDGPTLGVGVGSRCCTPSPRTKAILSASEEEEVSSTATVAADIDAIWPTGRPRGAG